MSAIRADQVPLAARVLANAFANAPRYRFLLPNDAQRHATLPWLWGAMIRASILSDAVVHVAHEEPGSPPLGVAVWAPPGHRKYSVLTLVRSGLWAAPFRLGIAVYRRRRSLGPLLAALGPPEPHWYLNVIGVDPTQQRTGAGNGAAALDARTDRRRWVGRLPRHVRAKQPWLLRAVRLPGHDRVKVAERHPSLGSDKAAKNRQRLAARRGGAREARRATGARPFFSPAASTG